VNVVAKKLSSALAGLDLQDLHEIRNLVDQLIIQKESHLDVHALPSRGDVLEIKKAGSITYRLEKVSCGKGCKGCPHGPYWYGYWREGSKIRSKYIGKRLRQL
jgi:hypothetical protein